MFSFHAFEQQFINLLFLFLLFTVAPIIYRPPTSVVLTRQNGIVRLECLASGNPAPNITWTRRNNVMPSGMNPICANRSLMNWSHLLDHTLVSISADYRVQQDALLLHDMDRHKAGLYVCSADNGVGDPVIAVASVQVACEYITTTL